MLFLLGKEVMMLKACLIIGVIISLLSTFVLWCAVKVGSDDDDFWGISDVQEEPPYDK